MQRVISPLPKFPFKRIFTIIGNNIIYPCLFHSAPSEYFIGLTRTDAAGLLVLSLSSFMDSKLCSQRRNSRRMAPKECGGMMEKKGEAWGKAVFWTNKSKNTQYLIRSIYMSHPFPRKLNHSFTRYRFHQDVKSWGILQIARHLKVFLVVIKFIYKIPGRCLCQAWQ